MLQESWKVFTSNAYDRMLAIDLGKSACHYLNEPKSKESQHVCVIGSEKRSRMQNKTSVDPTYVNFCWGKTCTLRVL